VHHRQQYQQQQKRKRRTRTRRNSKSLHETQREKKGREGTEMDEKWIKVGERMKKQMDEKWSKFSFFHNPNFGLFIKQLLVFVQNKDQNNTRTQMDEKWIKGERENLPQMDEKRLKTSFLR
jgi:hypothetical protein